ncbi:MAG: HAD family hydrolase [Clostridiales bacterium]|jgi:phosphoglycolate phosphatase|nr:HAD family hydrolase [Clostridiales bacterium]
MKYEAIIFDFDYTLADATWGITESFNYALEKLGYTAQPVEKIRPTVGMVLADVFKIFTNTDNEAVIEELKKYFKIKADEVMINKTSFFPDAVETLTYIKDKGIKTGIVSSKNRTRIHDFFKEQDALYLIDKIIGFEDVSAHKPNPEGLNLIIESLAINKKVTLYAGDSIIDAKAAGNADVDFVAVLNGTTSRDDFRNYKCVEVFDNLIQIEALV